MQNLFLLALLAACTPVDGPIDTACDCGTDINMDETPCCVDNDQDGYTESEGDCDDNHTSVNPSAADSFGDNIDQNCDGVDGIDNDRDGFSQEDDCNDNDGSISPGASEVPYDGLDNDCSEETVDDDLDQDGFVLEDDCNDNDATISPEGIEQIDGIDQNCNEADGDNLTFTLVVYSEGPSLFVGHDPRLANLSPIWHFGFTDGISTDWMCADPTQDSVCLNLYRRGNNEYTGVIPTVDLYTFILWAEDQCYVGGYSPSLYAGLGCNLLPNP